MYTVMGITGQIGGVVGHALLAANQQVRAVVRDADKGRAWADRGCEVAQATIEDAASPTTAFRGAEGVFVLVPSSFDPTPGFPEARTIGVTLRAALEAASLARVVYLSTIGAQATRSNLLTQSYNHRGGSRRFAHADYLSAARMVHGKLSVGCGSGDAAGRDSEFLQPLDKPVPMVATADIGRVAAGLLQENWSGRRVVELEGPQRVAPNEIASTFAKLLRCPVRMEAVPRESWEGLFKSQGTKNPLPRMQMLDGFNEGWIEFENGEAGSQKGSVALESVLKALIEGEGDADAN